MKIKERGLNQRFRKVLEFVVTDYISTAEPVGSRTICKRYGIQLSPATVRNVMADLEDLGFLWQPHTSAGRIPTDKAFRAIRRECLPGHRDAGRQTGSLFRG